MKLLWLFFSISCNAAVHFDVGGLVHKQKLFHVTDLHTAIKLDGPCAGLDEFELFAMTKQVSSHLKTGGPVWVFWQPVEQYLIVQANPFYPVHSESNVKINPQEIAAKFSFDIQSRIAAITDRFKHKSVKSILRAYDKMDLDLR